MNKIQILVKVRPRTEEEIKHNLKDYSSIRTSIEEFKFEHTFGPTCTNSDVHEVIAPMVERCKIGYNATVLSYGPKSSGKTYTMIGNDNDPGLAILAIRQLFKENPSAFNRQFVIRVGFIEIYNEVIHDLFNHRQVVQVDKKNDESNIKLSNKEVVVSDKQTILKLLDRGNKAKLLKPKTDTPSCSHTIFQIIIENQTLENGPAEVGHLNLVDLDRSEGAQVKNEKGKSFDKGLKYLELAIRARNKGETFPKQSKSKLTRVLNVGVNSDTAIICHVIPTLPNQTKITLNFANEARNVITIAACNKVHSDDVLIKRIRANIARLQRLKNDSDPQSLDSSKFDSEIADLNLLLLSGKDMRPQGHTQSVETNQVLKIRQFSSGLVGIRKKYQIGEMKDTSVDAQSRSQRKVKAFEWSDCYLERVGFELSLNMRRHLKYGKNVIGRSTNDSDVDICVDSLECSRRHCNITISADGSAILKDLNSSNGTTVNGIQYKNQTMDLHDGDVISIVGGNQSLVGNFDCTAYRLCRFTTEKIQFFDLDEDPIVIADDDGDDDTPYRPIKNEPESLELTRIVDQPTVPPTALGPPKLKMFSDLPPTTSIPRIENETESVIVIDDDDDDNDTSYYPVKMELELPEPSSHIDIGTEQLLITPTLTATESRTTSSTTTPTTSHLTASGSTTPTGSSAPLKDDGNFNLGSFVLDDAAFDVDLNDIISIPMNQDENVSEIRSENALLLQQLQICESEKKLQAVQIMHLQAKLSAQEAERNVLMNENAAMAVKLREAESDMDALREKNLKHIGELLEHFYEGKKAKVD